MSTASFSPLPPQTPSSRSNHTMASTDHFHDASDVFEHCADEGHEQEDAVHFCLLAEFDIDAGATLAYQYPYPTGTDEHRLAELMLPDGAHLRPEDWTVFYLGQTASSAVAPLLSHESSVHLAADAERRTSMAPTSGAKRGVAGGGLLYVLNCVRMKEDKKMRRGAMVKALAICTPNPYIGIYKPLLLLALEEFFMSPTPEILARLYDSANAISLAGMPRLTRSERILLRSLERKDLFEEKYALDERGGNREDCDDHFSELDNGSVSSHQRGLGSSSSSNPPNSANNRSGALGHGSSNSQLQIATPSSRDGRLTPDAGYDAEQPKRRKGVPRDTHFYETEARFKKITVPIRIPMTVFDEDVGDYSIIELVQTFSHPNPFPAPYHPYLHTNGAATHPVILILNALLAYKRVMFLGYGLPANQVARIVLAACALVSGCGQVLRGFTECAFPYANLASLDILEEFNGFVAGVTNPRFEELPMTWDVLCNLETGKVTVSKDLRTSVSTMRQASDSSLGSMVKIEEDTQGGTPQSKMNSSSKADCLDNQFMDDILAAIAGHYGEAHIRLRFTDYLERFVRLAAYQEYTHTGSTKIGYPSVPYREGVLGSGAVFTDDAARQKEMWASGHRVDVWRKTKSYRLYAKDWAKASQERAVADFDLQHQIARLRTAKNMSDSEAGTIFSALAEGVRTHDQVVEVGRQSVASMNYFHRKTYLHLLEQRDILVQQQREQIDRMRLAQEYASSPQRHTYASDLASPGTVHGSATNTPQGVTRA